MVKLKQELYYFNQTQGILQNEGYNPNVRVQSAKMILDMAHRIHEEKNYKERFRGVRKSGGVK